MFRDHQTQARRDALVALLVASSFVLRAPSARAQPETSPADELLARVIVSATRVPTPQSEVASSVTLITAADIDAQQARTLPDILQTVPGLNVVQTGGPGGATSVFMRGTNSNHVKILIDGIDVSDPSTPTDTFDLQHVLLADIDRIEVLRGPQSGLYGSDAIGGAIYILTKAGAGPLTAAASLEGGSFGTFNQTGSVSGASGGANYAFTVDHFRSTDTPVTPLDLLPPGEQRNADSYDNKSFSTKLGTKLNDDLDVSVVARYVDSTLLFTGDNFNVFPSVPDAARSEEDVQQLFTRASAHFALLQGLFEQTLGVGYSHDHTSDYGPEVTPSINRGDRLKVDWQGNIRLATNELLVVGAEHQRDAIEQSPISAQTTTNAGFAQLQSSFGKRFFDTISVRYDDNDRFGSKTTYRLAPEFIVTETGTTLKGSIGSGFKAPTLNQLFVSFPDFHFFANPNLKPESSVGYDLGFEQALLEKKLRFGITYFHNHIRDLISENSTFTTEVNIDRATTYGFENFVAYTPSVRLVLRADYTYTLATDDISHAELLRRPKVKSSLASTWQASDALSLTATMVYVGPWMDDNRAFTNLEPLTAGGYATTNIAANYVLSRNLSLFGRINNLFDRRYEDPVGFDRPGLGIFAGVKASL
ncbi:MAG TPA: TonB-dependent receptor [Steroidobacteraceae bacterium]|jgi:vitamin B12 transporter|nr:TonB-dependent receptor [Steroidobacteraceae bacterium]